MDGSAESRRMKACTCLLFTGSEARPIFYFDLGQVLSFHVGTSASAVHVYSEQETRGRASGHQASHRSHYLQAETRPPLLLLSALFFSAGCCLSWGAIKHEALLSVSKRSAAQETGGRGGRRPPMALMAEEKISTVSASL